MSDKITRILLIEDNPDDARVICQMLADTTTADPVAPAFDLTRARRLSSGLKQLAAERFDALLLDLSLPDSQGLDTFVKAQAQAPQTPIIVLSDLDDKLALEAVQKGAQDYLVKGEASASMLVRAIRYAIERKRLEAMLGDSQAELAAVVENAPLVMLIVDQDVLVQKVNHAAIRFAGLPAEEMIGRRGGEVLRCLHNLDDPRGCGFGPSCETCTVRRTVTDTIEKGICHTHVQAGLTVVEEGETKDLTLLLSTAPLTVAEKPMILLYIEDITEHKQAEEALRQSEEKHRAVADFTYGWEYWLGPDGRYIYVSPSCERITGYRMEEFVEDPALLERIVHPDDRALVAEHLAQARLHDGDHTIDFRIIARGGEERWIGHCCQPVYDHEGQYLGRRGSNCDITEHKRAEEALTEQYAILRSIIDSTNALIFSLDRQYRYTSFNKGHAAVMKAIYGAEVKVGHSLLDYMTVTEDRETARHNLDRALAGEHLVEEAYSGEELLSRRYFQVSHSPIQTEEGEVIGVAVLAQDITEHKQSEQIMMARLRLREAALTHTLEEVLQATLDEVEAITGSSIGFYHFLEADQRTISLQAWSTRTLKEFCTATGKGLHYDIDQAGVWVDCVRERRPVIHNDYAALPHRKGMPEGHAKVIREIVVPVFRGEQIVAILGVGNKPTDYGKQDIKTVSLLADLAWDIAEHKRAEEAVREKQNQLLEAQHIAHIGNWWHDLVTGEVYWSDEFFRIIGLEPQKPTMELATAIIHPDDFHIIQRAMDEAAAGKAEHEHEFRIIRPDGGIRWIHNRWVGTYEAGKEIKRIGTHQDITERKKAEEEHLAHLRFLESMDQVNRAIQGTNDLEQMMSDVLDVVQDIFDCDRASLVYPCDPEAASWKVPMERTRPEYPGAHALGVETPTDPDVAQTFRVTRASSGPVKFGPESEHPLPTEVAERFGFKSFIAMALYPKVGKPWEFVLHQCSYPRVWTPQEERLFQEVGRRLADGLTSLLVYRDLQESELRYREIFENTSDVIVITEVTKDGRFRLLDFNPAWETIIGLSRTGLVGRFLEDFSTDETARTVLEQYHVCLEKKIPIDFETGLVTAMGHQYLHTTLIPVSNAAGDIYRLVGVSRNITERKRAEEALQQSEERFRALYEDNPSMYFMLDAQGTVLSVNPFGADQLGYTVEELIGQSVLKVFYPDDREVAQQQLMACLEHPGQVAHWEFRKVRQDGSTLWVQEAARAVQGANGRPIVLVVCEDITERRRAEAEREHLLAQVREQAHRVQEIMDTVPEGVLLLDANCRVLLANPLGQRDLATLANAQVGDILTRLGDRSLAELLTSPPKGLWHEVAAESRSLQAIARPIEDGPTPKGWVLVIRDVTRQREVEQRIQQQERLAALGQLAAGIAHDFNNIMAAISLYAGMLLRITDLPSLVYERLEIVDQQARRASDLVQQVLDFSRRAVLERGAMDLLAFLKEQINLLERTLPESIEVKLVYGKDEYTVNADPTRMQQVVMNMATNARDAMPQGGGQLSFDLERIHVQDRASAPLPDMEAGDWIRVTIADTGTGIPPDVLPHIFEPFFTTKAAGVGTGLGLAQVYGIVKQHEGAIDVKTEVGAGTTFVLYLPALIVPQPQSSPSRIERLPQGHGEIVLVVEDDAVACQAVVSGLETLGYQVLQATNGLEALDVFEQHADEIELVLSDVVMPEMGGRSLLHALRQRDPAVRVVLLTGYPLENKEFEELRILGLKEWALKPLSIEQLAQIVARALGDVEHE